MKKFIIWFYNPTMGKYKRIEMKAVDFHAVEMKAISKKETLKKTCGSWIIDQIKEVK